MVDLTQITRDEVLELVTQADNLQQDRELYVREQLIERYPGLENARITRNRKSYSALDYLITDLGSYGGTE